jgi:uncharacterized membrane protein
MTASLFALTDATHAQTTPRYRVTDLKDLNDTTISADSYGTMGINNKGQVVYTWLTSGDYRAWLWLPEAEYGFAANTIHTIGASGSHSIARDINENGKVAGVSGGLYKDTNSRATIWTLASGSATATTMSGGPSEAYALSNDSSPHVVGQRFITNNNCNPNEANQAFAWVVGGSTTALEAVGNDFEDQASSAYDIRRNGDDVTVGLSAPCGTALDCIGYYDGTAWQPTTGTLVPLGSIRQAEAGNARRSRPYGVNDDTKAAGWVLFDPTGGQQECFPTAAYWDSPTDSTPIDLAEYLEPEENEFDPSRAFAINSLDDPQLVGRNEFTGHAILWEFDSPWTGVSGWSSRDLNNHDPDPDPTNYIIAGCSANKWEITEAHDINDNGWIVALGETVVSSTLYLHALLLTPEPCPYDVDNDGDIDEDDAAAILGLVENPASPTICPPAIICHWDVNFDCQITRADLELVLDYLETCVGFPCQCEGESFGGESQGLSAEDFAAAMAAHEPALGEEQVALGWECFFAELAD